MDVDIYQLGSGTKRVLAQPNLVGSVHSVFENTINLNVADHILSLQHSSLAKIPFMLSLPPGDYLRDLGLTVGTLVRVKEGSILVGDHRFKLASARHWEGRLPVFFANQEQVRFLWAGITRTLKMAAKKEMADGIGGHLRQVMQPVLRLLKTAKIGGQEKRVSLALTSLIGLGPGLTPSGDDFLIGFLSVLSLMGKLNLALSRFAAVLRKAVGDGSLQTSPLSREFLYYACREEYSEPFHKLYMTAASLDEQGLLSAAFRFIGMGHTSGVAGLTGVLHGLDFCTVD